MKKEKVKPVEEVIDVVGDFGPGPAKQDDSVYQTDDNFDMSFDIADIQNDPQQLQDQAMLPPHLGEIQFFFHSL